MRITGNAARLANPLFNSNKLKMGVFFANIGGGARPTLAEDRTRLSWPSVVEIAQMADGAGIEAFIPLATWSARNRDSDFTKYSYEPWTWAAAIAQATHNICVFTTAQVPIFPPVVAAKLTATVDHISNGRFAINVVCGHAGQALEGLVGAPDLGHDEWYAYADEWIEILDRLWSEPDIFDYSGRYFELKGAGSYPKPVQQPRPPIMNAGNSDVGQRWAARHSDMMFTAAPTGDDEAIKAKVDHIRGIATEYGREVEVWMSSSVVVRPTEREALEYLDYYAVDHADLLAVASLLRHPTLPAVLQALPAATRREQLRRMVAGSFNMQILVGTPEQLVDRLINLSKAGVDGLNMTFVNYQDELCRVVNHVLPLLEQAGLRGPFARQPSATG
ncbi:MAG: LLM class flavin-dependent oxidoreductase [Chloroflexi bacterium]|nr:LLM class flavin-dependent oxidoreductase [Chloroflexota bacterium]